jgi:DNA repair photolyase
VLAEFRNPVSIITKNHLVTRDGDVLEEMAAHEAALVNVSVTTLDAHLHHIMEPRTSTPARRLAAIEMLAKRGIPVRVMMAPVIPGLTDHEVPRVLEAARDAGAQGAGWVMLRLPFAVASLFEDWLERHFPDRKEKVLNRVRSMRGGRLNDVRFANRMRGEGAFAEQIRALFDTTCRRLHLNEQKVVLSTAGFRRPATGGQLGLFE